MTPDIHNLKSVTAALLSPVLDYSGIMEAANSLKKIFSEAIAFDEMETVNLQNIPTQAGMSIAPRWAVSCIADMMRTRKFILGIRDAITERLKINPGKPVTVLYAGTGPFASLLTPLITIFTPAQLQLVLVEINPVSVRYMKQIIKHFDMVDYVVDVVQADAVTLVISPKEQPDIIVSETMNNALQKEPQVSIVANLLSQCTRKPVLIPQLIKVDVCLIGDITKYPEDIILLKTLIELDAKMAVHIKNNPRDIPALSQGITVTIPELPDAKYNQLVLCTFIHVFGQHSLGLNESGLTIPHILRMTDSFKKYPVQLLFKYHVDSNPGFRVTAVPGMNE